MLFRYYANAVSRATMGVAKGLFTVGLVLCGLGVLVLALPEVFAFLVAGLCIVAGVSLVIAAGRIFWRSRKIGAREPREEEPYRENVHIHHIEDRHDF